MGSWSIEGGQHRFDNGIEGIYSNQEALVDKKKSEL